MHRIHGSHGQIMMDPLGGSALALVASMNSWTLNSARDRADVTAFGDANKIYVQGLADIKGNLGGWLDTDDLTIFNVAGGTVAATLELIPSDLVPAKFWKGLAFIDANVDVKSSGGVAMTGSFVAAGAWIPPVFP